MSDNIPQDPSSRDPAATSAFNGQSSPLPVTSNSTRSHRIQSASVAFMEPSHGNDGSADPNSPQGGYKPRSRGRSLLDEIAAQSTDNGSTSSRPRAIMTSQAVRYDPYTGQLVSRRQSRRDRQAQHHTIPEQAPVDNMIQGGEAVASLTSASTTSSAIQPETPSDFSNLTASPPLVASSPVEIPDSSFGLHKSPPFARSSLGDRSGSFRRSGRRGSTRVGSSSMSPASAFLSQWSRDESMLPTEPDDEGQEIGDSGEYIIGRQLGFGGFSVVKEAFTIQDNERVRRAVKIVRKHINGRTEQENEQVQNEFEHEVSIWRCLNHTYILPLIAVFDSPFATFCITKCNTGGTLFDLVRRQRRSYLSEVDLKSKSTADSPGTNSSGRRILPIHHVKRYIYQTACAIRYLHQDMRIVHRDIKLENCLLDITPSLSVSLSSLSASVSSLVSLSSESNDRYQPIPSEPGNVLLCDFGMANFISREDREAFIPSSSNNSDQDRSSLDGTPTQSPHNIGPGPTSANMAATGHVPGSLPYASPELINSSVPLYEPSIDIWAFGVLCYALLTGDLPFNHSLAPKVHSMISKGQWDESYASMCIKNIVRGERDESIDETKEINDVLELLRGCLDKNVQTRWDIVQVLQCGFLDRGTELYERDG